MSDRHGNRKSNTTELLNDAALDFIGDLAARVVAKSGIPSDRYHIGKLMLQSLKDAPDFVCQIDAGTGRSETNGSVLERSIRCSTSFTKMGLVKGDVITIMAPSHLDMIIPFYAALFTGLIISPVDRNFRILELKNTLQATRPQLIFCQSEKEPDIKRAIEDLDFYPQIISFDKGPNCFDDIMEKYGSDADIDGFEATHVDPDDTALIIATSGTTGSSKFAATTYKNYITSMPGLWRKTTNFPTPIKMFLVNAPLQWLTTVHICIQSPILRYVRLQTSKPPTPEHLSQTINTYKPSNMVLSPTFVKSLQKLSGENRCDFSCFETIYLGGSAVPQKMIEHFKILTPHTNIQVIYGLSETTGTAFYPSPTPGSCGQPMSCWQYRIVDVDTQQDIVEPNIPGELWIKGSGVFKEYYNNPEATASSFAPGRWFKTGDLFYRDDKWNFIFIDKIKLLLKYKSNQISPVELENVIRQLPGVLDVAVSAIPDDSGELPVACVVKIPGSEVTAEKVKNIVKENLADHKQLRGGVIFLSEIPMTATTKIHRTKLKEMVLVMDKE